MNQFQIIDDKNLHLNNQIVREGDTTIMTYKYRPAHASYESLYSPTKKLIERGVFKNNKMTERTIRIRSITKDGGGSYELLVIYQGISSVNQWHFLASAIGNIRVAGNL